MVIHCGRPGHVHVEADDGWFSPVLDCTFSDVFVGGGEFHLASHERFKHAFDSIEGDVVDDDMAK